MSASRRDALVTCASCGREVQRRARQQRFCSDRCRNREIGRKRVRKAFLGRSRQRTPQKKIRNSRSCKGPKRCRATAFSPLRTFSPLRCSPALGSPRPVPAALPLKSAACALGRWCHEQAKEGPPSTVRATDPHDVGVAGMEATVVRRALSLCRSAQLSAARQREQRKGFPILP